MEQYKLPSHNNSDKVFIVNRSELEGRIEPLFYQPSSKIPNDIKVKFTTLSRCTKTIVHPPEYPREFSDNGFQLIRSQNVRPLGLSLEENPVYFSADFLSDKKIILAQKGDLLVVRSGVNAGDTAVVEEDYSDIIVGADTLLCKAIPTINPKFIQVYFYTNFGKTQIIKHTTGATNKHLNSENLAKVLVPLVDSKIQTNCVKLFEDSLNLKQQKEAEAKTLLDSIDSYLLGELGIKYKYYKANKYGMYSLEKEIYSTPIFYPSSKDLDLRYDPSYYLPIYKEVYHNINKSENKLTKIKNISTCIQSGKAPNVFYEEGIHYLKVRNIKDCSIDWNTDKINEFDVDKTYLLNKGDVLLVTMGAGSLGKATVLEDNIVCQYDPKITRFVINEKKANIHYFLYYLRSNMFQKLLEKEIRGSTGMTMLNPKDIGNLPIPLPPLEKQNEIAQHIQNVREQAKQLQNDAKIILEQAKKEVELMILG